MNARNWLPRLAPWLVALHAIGSACSSGEACDVCERACTADADCDGLYACEGGICRVDCVTDDGCKTGSSCSADGACVTLVEDGLACEDGENCRSGFCVDGLCCDSECAAGCVTCAGETPGICVRDPGAGCDSEVGDATSLQAALDAAADGGVVVVTESLTGNVVIDAGGKSVRIEGSPDGDPPVMTGDRSRDPVIHIQDAAGVEIHNLEITGGAFGVKVDAPVPVTLTAVTLRENVVGVAVDHGDAWVPEALLTLDGCDLWHNSEQGLRVISAPVDLGGVRFSGNLRALRVERSQLFGMRDTIVAQSAGLAAAYFVDSGQVTITSSLFWQNNGLGALVLNRVSDAELEDLVFNGNATAGIQVWSSTNVVLRDVIGKGQFNPLFWNMKWTRPDANVDIGDTVPDDFFTLPMAVFTPVDLEEMFGDSYWQGNGMEINDSGEIHIHDAFLGWNDGSGILARDSSNVFVHAGDFFMNAMSGITAARCDATIVWRASVYNNTRAGIQAVEGSMHVALSNVNGNFPDETDAYGFGLSIDGGTHQVLHNTIVANPLSGILLQGGAEATIEDNQIHGGHWAIVKSVGCVTQEADNIMSCGVGSPCSDWSNIDPVPSPPAQLPSGLDGL